MKPLSETIRENVTAELTQAIIAHGILQDDGRDTKEIDARIDSLRARLTKFEAVAQND